MNVRVGVCLVWMCAWGAVAQEQPGLQARPAVTSEPKSTSLAAMKVPEKLEAARAANSNTIYQALRGRAVNGPAFTVKNLTLKRDAGVFTFSDGTFYLYSEVNGRVTGAVFLGQGRCMWSRRQRWREAAEDRDEDGGAGPAALRARCSSLRMGLRRSCGRDLRGHARWRGIRRTGAEAQALFRKNLKYDIEARLLEDVVHPGWVGSLWRI